MLIRRHRRIIKTAWAVPDDRPATRRPRNFLRGAHEWMHINIANMEIMCSFITLCYVSLTLSLEQKTFILFDYQLYSTSQIYFIIFFVR